MKRAKFLLAAVAALVALSLALAATGSPDSFIIENADATKTLGLTGSPTLTGLIGNVLPRFMLTSADASRTRTMTPPPAALLGLIGTLSPRFVLSYADESTTRSLTYPAGLIGDTAGPEISGSQVTAGNGALTFSWATDEYAVGRVDYGTQPGQLTSSRAEDSLRRQHSMTISGLADGQTIYYRLVSMDRSNNVTATSETSVTLAIDWNIYLPSVTR